MPAFNRQNALNVMNNLGLPDDKNFLYAFASKPLRNEIIWNILSNTPQLFSTFFEYPVIMAFTATKLYVHAVGGKHKGETTIFDNSNISSFQIRASVMQTNIEFFYDGKPFRFWFMADSTGRVAYVSENYRNLNSKGWFDLI